MINRIRDQLLAIIDNVINMINFVSSPNKNKVSQRGIPIFHCDIPIYTHGPTTNKEFSIACVRSSDIKDEDRKTRLEIFMIGQTRMLVDEDTIPWEEQDFIYLCDYENFCHQEKTGKYLFWD